MDDAPPPIHMKIGITLDGIISARTLEEEGLDTDLYCLNQIANEQGWYASSRWFASGHDVFFITGRANQSITDRWLEEWALMYNRVIYGIPTHLQYNAAAALGCHVFITSSVNELPRHGNHEIPTYFYSREPLEVKIPKGVKKIHDLYEIDKVIESWPHPPKQSSVSIVGQSRTLLT